MMERELCFLAGFFIGSLSTVGSYFVMVMMVKRGR